MLSRSRTRRKVVLLRSKLFVSSVNKFGVYDIEVTIDALTGRYCLKIYNIASKRLVHSLGDMASMCR